MSEILFGACAFICIGGFFLHELKGTPMMIPPLDDSDLQPNVKSLLKFSWHAGSILSLGIGALFAFAISIPGNELMSKVGTAMLIGMALIALSMAYKNPVIWETPAPYLWPFSSLLGIIGLYL
ncbi:hypothetical protein N9S24_01890 [SAR86 cluster bacterium]|jgi:hypothetical protein|nr:hypothetical protein [SAR86 cluster bacterium]